MTAPAHSPVHPPLSVQGPARIPMTTGPQDGMPTTPRASNDPNASRTNPPGEQHAAKPTFCDCTFHATNGATRAITCTRHGEVGPR